MKRDAYYFPHYSNARNHPKIIKLRRVHGIEGYGMYFMLLEVLRDQNDYCYPLDGVKDLAYEWHVSEEILGSVIRNFNLFVVENDRFFLSETLRDTMSQLKLKSQKLSEAGKKGRKKQLMLANAETVRPLGPGPGNEIKRNKTEKKKEIDIPSFLEFKEYGLSKKPDVNEEALKLKYEAWVENGWKDGNNKPVKNWKSKLLNTIGHLPTKEVNSGIQSFKDKEYLNDVGLNELFIKYLEVRKQLRHPTTEDVIEILKKELRAVAPTVREAEEIIERAITNGHKTFYPLKD